MSVHACLATATVVVLSLSLAVSAFADGEADARFRGAGQIDPPRIANATCKPAGDGVAAVSFDLAWDWSWRAAWEEPAERHGGNGPLKLESWDAAWVFVKFRNPGADWAHATLATTAAEHQVPAGAKLDVGLSDDGQRGLGAFVYRLALGSGKNDWKGVTLRWRYGADGVVKLDRTVFAEDRAAAAPRKGKTERQPGGEPGDALDDETKKLLDDADASEGAPKVTELRVCAIPMVYVPECAFWLGDGSTDVVAGQFTAGDTTRPLRIESEQALTLGGADPANLGNSDAINRSPAWPAGLYDDFCSALCRPLPASFPKGYAAFYCMRREVTLGDFVSCLNTLDAGAGGAVGEIVKQNGAHIRLEGAGPAAAYVTDAPHGALTVSDWTGRMVWIAWAGLRPMSELEFEKACRGPLTPVAGEYAWGTGQLPAEDERDPRVAARASYWGIRYLSGNQDEVTIGVGHPLGRRMIPLHGNGTPAPPGVWGPLACARKLRGGSFVARERTAPDDPPGDPGRVSFRGLLGGPGAGRAEGIRAVRSRDAGRHPIEAPDETPLASLWFNDALRITNLTTAARDAASATISFDIAWDDSWRDAKNHDAAWVFFKVRARGAKDWRHARLVADRVLDPTGYGQAGGTKLEFLVPAGPDGFTGVFLQRAEPGAGRLEARGVTAVADLTASPNTDHLTPITDLQAFGLEMVHVPEGPFHLGSGGQERNHFYQYTDGSQNAKPYRVTDAGLIATGPQAGRLWAAGAEPDASDAGAVPAEFPSGYRGFYCMKDTIRQGQFGAFLLMQDHVKSDLHAYATGNGTALRMRGYAFWSGLRWAEGAAFGAWAGLRPMTELEYEKACRGPGEPAPYDVDTSYWRIRDLSCGQVEEPTVSVASPRARAFRGTHGDGTPELPADWPPAEGQCLAYRETGTGHGGCGTALISYRRIWGEGENCWRGVRTDPMSPPAPGPVSRAGFKLELDPLPDLAKTDVGVFHLTGRFHSGSDQPLAVKLITTLPETCFPDGPAALALKAAPKAATSFKILTVLTRQTGRVSRRGQLLPIRIQAPGGDLLAEQTVRLPLLDPLAETPPVVGSLAGGKVSLLVTNATDRPQSLAFEMASPPDVKLAETSRSVEIAAGAKVEVAFAMPGQVFATAGFRCIPYRVTVAKSGPQAGEVIAELRVESRWWVTQRQIQSGLAAGSDGPESTGNELDGLIEESGLADSAAKKKEDKRDNDWVAPSGIFKTDRPSGAWRTFTHGASLWLSKFRPLPTKDTIVEAATRVISPAAREVDVRVASESKGWTWLDDVKIAHRAAGYGVGTEPFRGRIFLNGEVVYDSRPGAKHRQGPARLKQDANPLLVQCHANAEGDNLANVFVLFYDPKTGRRFTDLAFDVEEK